MGTSNFARGNTSKVFAVLMNEEVNFKKCNECGETFYEYDHDLDKVVCCEGATFKEGTESRSCESEDYEDFKSHLQELAETESKETTFKYSEEDESDRDRNYCGTDLFSLQTSKSYGDIEVELRIVGKIVGGYYEGASLDYRLEIYNGAEWSEVSNSYYKVSVSDIVDSLFESEYNNHSFSNMNRGLRKMILPKAIKWAEEESNKMIILVEQIFTKISTPLNVVARFSNGETIYAKSN
jgi:hypothetical protein